MSSLEGFVSSALDCMQCPVCFELPTSVIEQCEQGHIVCSSCRKHCTSCPVCRGIFYGTRNYALEELIERMKNVQSNENGVSTKPAKPKSAQKNASDSAEGAETTRIVRRCPPNASKGFFSCLFNMCKDRDTLPASRMLDHVRYYHKDNLIEASTNGCEYTNTYKQQYIPGAHYVNAVQISDMGLFFLVVEITREGMLYGFVRMVSHHDVAKKFNYQLKITSPNNAYKATFMNEVRSVREPHARTLSTKLNECLAVDGYIEKHLRKNKIFTCKMDIMFARPNLPESARHGLPTHLTVNNRRYPASPFNMMHL